MEMISPEDKQAGLMIEEDNVIVVPRKLSLYKKKKHNYLTKMDEKYLSL